MAWSYFASAATRKSKVKSRRGEWHSPSKVLIGKAFRILRLVSYFCHPALESVRSVGSVGRWGDGNPPLTPH
ncbi:hypothetical protein [Okeania sp. SIO2B3]|uniref:hypothetical protein n=1 Tax=Okeania sp. SIO2B3 TaxID=2607784 RepID=UPI0013BF60F9|nr:hypothetical protein [Okeania sp. SIO2B3]NET43051.1 hypothetical protein [Okeania sp. SIO2B3]